MRWILVALLAFCSPALAQRGNSGSDLAVRTADTVSVASYFVVGIVSGIPTSYASSIAFTDDRSARTIVLSASGVAAAIALWARASRIDTAGVAIPPAIQDRAAYLQTYRSNLISRRRRAVTVGFLSGIALGFFTLLPPLQGT
jgi:hypothetical protein